MKSSLRVAVDIGGTFTDGVAVLSPAGRIWVGKTPTTPDDPGEAVSTVLLDLLKQVGAEAKGLGEVVHGTTLITNTLIERKGSRTALVATSGHADLLDIGREWRYDIYDLDIELPRPLVAPGDRVTVEERLDARDARLQLLKVAPDDRLHVGVRRGGRGALELLDFARHLGRERHRDTGQLVRQSLPDGTLVRVVDVGMQQRHRDRFDPHGF